MLLKMLNQAQYELLNYPHKSAGYYIARPFKIFTGRDNDPLDRLTYANASLAKAMLDYYDRHKNSEEAREIINVVKRYYNRFIMSRHRLYTPEDAYAGMALIDLHKITGEHKYKMAADAILQYLLTLDTDPTGTIISKKGKKNPYIYAETIGMTAPFLAKYGSEYEDMNATNLAVTQLQNFWSFGMDEKLVLPYHGYNYETGIKMGIVGWGQAVGKLMIGMSETLYYLEKDRPSYEAIRQNYRRMVDKVEAYQMEGGLYNWQLSTKEGPADTATTAMILYSIAQSLDDKVLIGIHKTRMLRGVEGLKQCIQEDGSLPGAAAESKGFNNYPIEFDSFPWALGPALSLMVLVEEEDAK